MTVRDHYGRFKIRGEYFLDKRQGKPGERYKVKSVIGQGTFGVVTLVDDLTTSRAMVLKTINKQRQPRLHCIPSAGNVHPPGT